VSEISFTDQVAIVTGAGRGLGRDYALELAHRGCRLVVCDIGGVGDADGSWAEKVASEIVDFGGAAIASHETVATSAGGDAIVEAAMSQFGRVDAVIHNAGFLRPAYLQEMTDTQFREVLDVHLVGAFNVCRPAWRYMKEQNYGRIVLTSSSSIFGYPASSNYVAAKAGVLGMTTALAVEGRDCGIRVNAVLPYAVSAIVADNPPVGETPEATVRALKKINPKRHGRSVAPLVAYLASSLCEVTGQAFSALSGRFARAAFFLSDGWVTDADSVTAEDIAANLDRIGDLDRGFYPDSMFAEIDRVCRDLEAEGIV